MKRKASAAFARASDGAVLVSVHVRPGASASSVGKVDPWRGCLEVQVRARAERGEANEELCSVIAAAVGVPARQVSIVKGPRSREKTVRVDGLDEAAVRAALEGSH